MLIIETSCYIKCQVTFEGFVNMDLLDRFIEIMKNKNSKVVTALGKYVYNSMIKRCEAIPYSYSSKS